MQCIRPAFALLVFAGILSAPMRAVPEYKSMGPDIFDRSAKAEEQIDQALTRARQENKRVVLLFGANWCPWCRRLHQAFSEAPALRRALQQHFILVYVDANTRHDKKRNAAVIERYGNPLRLGLPAMVVLDQDGTQLTTQETASLAAPTDEEVAKRVAAFLAGWAPRAR